jgi:hypothetical protein
MSHILKAKKEGIIMRKRKVRITVLGVVSIFIIAIWLLVPATQADAKTVKGKHKIVAPLTRVEWIAVPDMEKHVIVLYERRGVAIFENGETPAYHTRGTSDTIKGQGSFHGYSDYLFKDGSTIISEYTGTLTLAPGEKLRTIKGEAKYIKGTGRFEGIKGKASFIGNYVTPYTKDETKGDAIMDVTATYTLPSK